MIKVSKIIVSTLFVVTLILVISSCNGFLQHEIPKIILTETPVLRSTPTPSNTSTPSVTPSPHPTKTSTPQPRWVTEFAQPILSAIADSPPRLQDGFGAESSGWNKNDYCGSMKYIDEELVFKNCRVYRSNIDYSDFVLEVDVRVQSGSWELHFRDVGNNGHDFRIYSNGNVLFSFGNRAGDMNMIDFDNIAFSNNQTNHILMIAKENNFAFYLNGQPLYYAENDLYHYGRCVFFAEKGSVAMDNFKIWNISDVPAP
jgi:hypothetical protein